MKLDIKRILVPLDFRANSTRTLDYAHGLALEFGAALHLIHVCETPTVMTLDVCERELTTIKGSLADVTITTEVLTGNPAKSIVQAAQVYQADLIVMGTHGHGAVMDVLLGNVAERVGRMAPCPVLTVREPKTREALRAKPPQYANLVASVLAAGILLAPGWATTASAQEYQQTTAGSEVYRTYCASCHGASARGDRWAAMNPWTAEQSVDEEYPGAKPSAMDGLLHVLVCVVDAMDVWPAPRSMRTNSETLAA